MKSAYIRPLLAAASLAAPLVATLAAQTAAPAHPATATSGAHPTAAHPAATKTACTKLPEISPKVPALPAGLPCAKALYTIAIVPTVKLEYVSPLEGPGLGEFLGIDSSFTLAYVDSKVGTGALAAADKWYTINYTGYLIDGTKFDSSYDRHEPFTVQIGQHGVIAGWDTGFDGMKVGGKRRLFIPWQLAYGANGKPAPPGQVSIPPRAELIFDVELLSQSDAAPAPPPAPPAPPAPASSAPAAPATTPAAPANPPKPQ